MNKKRIRQMSASLLRRVSTLPTSSASRPSTTAARGCSARTSSACAGT